MLFKLLISSTLTNLCCFFVTEVRRLCVNEEGWRPRDPGVLFKPLFFTIKTDSCGTVLNSKAVEEERQKLQFYIFLVSQFVNEVENSVQGILLC